MQYTSCAVPAVWLPTVWFFKDVFVTTAIIVHAFMHECIPRTAMTHGRPRRTDALKECQIQLWICMHASFVTDRGVRRGPNPGPRGTSQPLLLECNPPARSNRGLTTPHPRASLTGGPSLPGSVNNRCCLLPGTVLGTADCLRASLAFLFPVAGGPVFQRDCGSQAPTRRVERVWKITSTMASLIPGGRAVGGGGNSGFSPSDSQPASTGPLLDGMTPLASLSLSLEGPSLITAHGERANAERVRRRAADCGTRETEKGPLLVLNW